MILYAVYTQWYPTYEYEPTLESIWTTKHDAIISAEKIAKETRLDYVWIETLTANQDTLNVYDDNHECISIKRL